VNPGEPLTGSHLPRYSPTERPAAFTHRPFPQSGETWLPCGPSVWPPPGRRAWSRA